LCEIRRRQQHYARSAIAAATASKALRDDEVMETAPPVCEAVAAPVARVVEPVGTAPAPAVGFKEVAPLLVSGAELVVAAAVVEGAAAVKS